MSQFRAFADVLIRLGDVTLDPVIATNLTGEIVYWNRPATTCFGWTSDEAVGRRAHELVVPRRLHTTYLGLLKKAQKAKNQAAGRYVIRALHKDGEEFDAELSVILVNVGRHVLPVCFVKKLPIAFEQHRILDARTNRLIHNSHLNAMGTLASALAHELSQPIGAAANYLSAARLGREAAIETSQVAIDEALRLATRSIERASAILNSIRQMATKQSIGLNLQRLEPLIYEALQLLPSGTNVDVEISVSPDAQVVLADQVKVEQVLFNLINNAAEALEGRADGLIRVVATRHNGYVHISVEDNGPGIPACLMDTLFESSKSAKPEGMGLGLALSRTICEALGGRIWAEQNRGRGTRISFSLLAADPTGEAK